MRQNLTRVLMATAGVALLLSLSAIPAGGQAGNRVARTADKRPNFNGIWQALNEAYWDIEPHAASAGVVPQLGATYAVPGGVGIVDGGTIPYTPAALKKKQENFANRAKLDPEIKCYLPGVPRAMYMPFPFQIVQTPKYIMMVYTFAGALRTIYMDDQTEAPADSWMGWSNGKWDGDTLVVDTTGFLDSSWFDRAGNHHSDALHIVERFTAAGPDHLTYEATIEDPKTFTRPWKITMPLYRRMEKNAQLVEFKCVEFAEDVIYGHLRKQTSR
jgi:hypothetical protein